MVDDNRNHTSIVLGRRQALGGIPTTTTRTHAIAIATTNARGTTPTRGTRWTMTLFISLISIFLIFGWLSIPLNPISSLGPFTIFNGFTTSVIPVFSVLDSEGINGNVNGNVNDDGTGGGNGLNLNLGGVKPAEALRFPAGYYENKDNYAHRDDDVIGLGLGLRRGKKGKESLATEKRRLLEERCKHTQAVPLDVNDSNIQTWFRTAAKRGRSDRFGPLTGPGIRHSTSPSTSPSSTPPFRTSSSTSTPNSANSRGAPGDYRSYGAFVKVTVLKNASIWTGRDGGREVIRGDVVMGEGVIKDVVEGGLLGMLPPYLDVVDVRGAWVTPGLVDLHSHIGVGSLPKMKGSADTNSHQAPILPFLRSIDGLNTHDLSYELTVAGGVTTAQVLPGSANNIGGQAYMIKLRKTKEGSPSSMVVDPPDVLFNRTSSGEVKWRHMKHACGENPDRRYSQSRMDAAWQFRNAYNEAKKVKDKQDDFCARVDSGEVPAEEFPESPLEWEALVDVLRGRVKISTHCYEAVDLDMIVRLSNEFKFPIASFHHAGETYLVPDTLKKTWGGTPSIALFAANARKKREAYRNSEFAPKILADSGVPVVMKSDHPVLNSRHLVYEAQQAHYYGLDTIKALQSVTTTPAKAAGLAHRLGYISTGYDADVVIWDSHPLSLGATPQQVYIDGIPQFTDPAVVKKLEILQEPPKTPDFSSEAQAMIDFDGLPPLEPKNTTEIQDKVLVFTNVSSVFTRHGDHIHRLFPSDRGISTPMARATVVVFEGNIVCYDRVGDDKPSCAPHRLSQKVIDLEGGSLVPGFTTFGSAIGLREISLEPSTNDGDIAYPLSGADEPSFGTGTILHAKDGLQFGGRNTLLAYRGGVTQAVVPPSRSEFVFGYATAFSTGAKHKLQEGAVSQGVTAFHASVDMRQTASVGTQVAALRRQLLESSSMGSRHVVFHVDSADIMATLIALKREHQELTGEVLPVAFAGAAEAHLIAEDIARENISVILTQSRPFPNEWDRRRILPGPPLSTETQVTYLMKKGINVALGTTDDFDARNARFDAAWAALASDGYISEARALELITVNLERALGVKESNTDLVVFKGGSAGDFESKVAAVISKRRGVVDWL
ncbi:hypothetical protein ONZ45_g603 [Pleurotus djamor]|nr:hypothetical protein ONZ45_g603 [Pleurotus djamor]